MAYAKNNLATNAIITKAALDNMEAGIAAAGGLKAWEDGTRSIALTNPSPESGLTAATFDGTGDQTARIQAALNYIKTTYGGGQLVLPTVGSARMLSGITIPAKVRIVGTFSTTLDFWDAPANTVCVTVNDADFTPITGIEIKANGAVSGKTGLKIHGFGLTFDYVRVTGFKYGIDMYDNDTYINSFNRCVLVSCAVLIHLDLGRSWNGRTDTVGNSGERTTFTDCTFANADEVFWASGSGSGLHFFGCSFDFVGRVGRQWDSHTFFTGCHFEFNGGTYDHGFLLMGYSRMSISTSNFILGGNLYHLISTTENPWSTTGGRAQIVGCDMWHPQTSAAVTAGALKGEFSETRFPVTTGATSLIVSSLLISSWTTTTVAVVANGGTAQANVTARITAINPTDGTATITLSAAAPAGTVIEVSF